LPLGLLRAVTLTAAAYISINLALAPRHLDIPIVLFALPAIALFATGFATRRAVDQREEALLAAIILGCGLMQIEAANP
jgi:hypothetical protein